MANIYDDVEQLKADVAALQISLSAMQIQVVVENTDIFSLNVGRYYVPSAAVAATLLNKPITNSWTAYIDVLPAGADGQKIIRYCPVSKDFESYYQVAYYSGSWGNWKTVSLKHTDWTDLPLASGITAYSEAQKPRYMRNNKTIFLSGVVKGLTTHDSLIGTLPAGFRPAKKVIFPIASVGQIISKMSVETDGRIVYNRSSMEPIVAENYHSIACCFESN